MGESFAYLQISVIVSYIVRNFTMKLDTPAFPSTNYQVRAGFESVKIMLIIGKDVDCAPSTRVHELHAAQAVFIDFAGAGLVGLIGGLARATVCHPWCSIDQGKDDVKCQRMNSSSPSSIRFTLRLEATPMYDTASALYLFTLNSLYISQSPTR